MIMEITPVKCRHCGSSLGPSCRCYYDSNGDQHVPFNVGGGYRVIKSKRILLKDDLIKFKTPELSINLNNNNTLKLKFD